MSEQPNASRLDRLEAVVEKIGDGMLRLQTETGAFQEETRKFQLAVRGAITAQQEQIEANARAIAALAESVKRHDQLFADLQREWQAYLRTIHPKQ